MRVGKVEGWGSGGKSLRNMIMFKTSLLWLFNVYVMENKSVGNTQWLFPLKRTYRTSEGFRRVIPELFHGHECAFTLYPIFPCNSGVLPTLSWCLFCRKLFCEGCVLL